jgi:hypothetical protein
MLSLSKHEPLQLSDSFTDSQLVQAGLNLLKQIG